jgi:Fe-S-cluster containining protein
MTALGSRHSAATQPSSGNWPDLLPYLGANVFNPAMSDTNINGPAPGALHQADTPWSYVCGRCGGCCRSREVLVNPFDIARLAVGVAQPVNRVLARHVDPSRPTLRTDADGWCTFYQPGLGCTVHNHRPAVCRYFPLGRHVTAAREVRYAEAEPVDGYRGAYGRNGTIVDYLRAQSALQDEKALAMLNAFIDDALQTAYRAGGLEQLDAAVSAIWQGEAGLLPAQALDTLGLCEPVLLGDPLDQLEAHLNELRALTGMDRSPQDQTDMAGHEAGRAELFRLIQIGGAIAASLGVQPGFSEFLREEPEA